MECQPRVLFPLLNPTMMSLWWANFEVIKAISVPFPSFHQVSPRVRGKQRGDKKSGEQKTMLGTTNKLQVKETKKKLGFIMGKQFTIDSSDVTTIINANLFQMFLF